MADVVTVKKRQLSEDLDAVEDDDDDECVIPSKKMRPKGNSLKWCVCTKCSTDDWYALHMHVIEYFQPI